MQAELRIATAALLIGASPSPADPALTALEGALPAEARETLRVTDPPRAYAIAIGPAGPMAPPPVRQRDGTRLRIAWNWPRGDTDAAQARLADALAGAGFETLFDCRTDACGGFDFRLALPVLPLPDMVVDLGDFRYIAAARDTPPALASVLISPGPARTHAQVTLVTHAQPRPHDPSPAEAPASAIPAAAPDLVAQLETAGRAVLEGLDFPPGSTALAAEGSAALSALATWLGAEPSRRVALVGHTDWTGTPAANLALSRARADAVADALAAMGSDPAQITTAGVGPFAPRAANAAPEGLAANRRVEVVRLPDAR
jgi:OOP family OmpA-OmpF porin